MPAIEYFPIIQNVIDKTIERITASRCVSRDQIYHELIEHLTNNSSEWYRNGQPQIPYNDIVCRLAYLYGQVAVNAALIEYVFDQDDNLSQYVLDAHKNTEQVNVCVFGGGPGTELLGIARWLERKGLSTTINMDFLLLDRVNEWIGSWYPLKDEIHRVFQEKYGARSRWPAYVTGSFTSIDMTDVSGLKELDGLFEKDLYIFCYVLSEIHENQQGLREFISLVSREAPPGAKFLFIDRNELDGDNPGHPKWLTEIVHISSQCDLRLSEYYYPTEEKLPYQSYTGLGKLFDDVRKHAQNHGTKHKGYPRSRWDAFWIVGTGCIQEWGQG